MWKWTNETRVREADAASRALRSRSVGSWVVERRGGRINPLTGSFAPGSGGWHEVSSHVDATSAERAKAKLDRKIAKG